MSSFYRTGSSPDLCNKAAHTLKGGCLSIAALRLAAQCRRMETAADEGRRADTVSSLAELEASGEELLAALRPYLAPA